MHVLGKPYKCKFEGCSKAHSLLSNLQRHEKEGHSKDQWDDIEKGSATTLTRSNGEGLAISIVDATAESDNKDLDVEKWGVDAASAAVSVSCNDPGPPPDGGWIAWMQVSMAHIIIFNTWGYINSFGVFQVYLVKHLDRSPSDVSWVGSIQIFLLFSIGLISGRATDAGLLRLTFAAGWIFQLLALFMTSLCKTYWQLSLPKVSAQDWGMDWYSVLH